MRVSERRLWAVQREQEGAGPPPPAVRGQGRGRCARLCVLHTQRDVEGRSPRRVGGAHIYPEGRRNARVSDKPDGKWPVPRRGRLALCCPRAASGPVRTPPGPPGPLCHPPRLSPTLGLSLFCPLSLSLLCVSPSPFPPPAPPQPPLPPDPASLPRNHRRISAFGAWAPGTLSGFIRRAGARAAAGPGGSPAWAVGGPSAAVARPCSGRASCRPQSGRPPRSPHPS